MFITQSQFLSTAGAMALLSSGFAQGAITLPHFEDFSSGVHDPNVAVVNSVEFNGFTYSVDGVGGVAAFDATYFLGADHGLPNLSGLILIGDWQWTGSTANGVQTFAIASTDQTAFALTSLDFATGDGGPPTVYTLTGYRAGQQVAQVAAINLSLGAVYGAGTAHEIAASSFATETSPYEGLHLDFTGTAWGNIDRIEFHAEGNDILVIVDNIHFSTAVPEPSVALWSVLGAVAWAGRRRRGR